MTKHKHYYAIRAYADGWKLESKSSVGWDYASSPSFSELREYRVVPDEDGWLPWYGGKCPLDGTVMVEVKYRHDITVESDYAHLIHWGHLYTDGDVIAYRVTRDKPKKMKLLAYINEVSGELLWRLEGYKVSSYWKRTPSEDKEIEVEE